ncbi:disease resistance protein RUN1-like [Bidens hawaiensis]|uniref:disease resistance protein RUN1-like n=1 Tax=Bidens hawaiensis TaxID=980011 RepID=UPI0040492BE3
MEHIAQMFRYDVFLSFRGEDTRTNFTSHLYGTLKRNSFEVFHDTALPRGQGIAPQLSEAIRISKIYVVVFSTHYANSKWCLDELSQMLYCMHTNDQQIVLPVFLDVKQTDIGNEHGPFKELITNDKTTFDEKTVQKWKEALQEVGELPGLHLQDDANGDESELLQKVVQKVDELLHGQPDINITDPHLVGIESRVQQVISLLNMGSDDVRVVVIHGPAGIGKTTIANATYKRLAIHFGARYSCFLSDVKTIFGERNGKLTLQKKLLSKLGQNDESQIRIDSYHQGIGKIKNMITNRKLLLVLDDVDNDEQLKTLGMNASILGGGSRIIVTTTHESNALDQVKPYTMYEPWLLDEDESLKVLCLKAFGQDGPKEGFEDVSREAARWGAGCPGVLKDLAVYIGHYQSVEQWGLALRYVIQNPSCLTDGSL